MGLTFGRTRTRQREFTCLKVTISKSTRVMCGVGSNLTIKTPDRCRWPRTLFCRWPNLCCWLWTDFTYYFGVSIVDLEQGIVTVNEPFIDTETVFCTIKSLTFKLKHFPTFWYLITVVFFSLLHYSVIIM